MSHRRAILKSDRSDHRHLRTNEVHRRDSRLLLSATDLVNFHECGHLSALDRAALDDEALKAQRTEPDDQAELLFRKGREFEASTSRS